MREIFIKRKKEEIEPEEILLDKLSEERNNETFKLEISLSYKILIFTKIFFLISIISLFGRTVYLQIIEREKYTLLSKKNFERVYYLHPKRGIIYDRNRIQLVFNEKVSDLVLDKRDLPREEDEKERILINLSKKLKVPFLTLKKKIEENKNFEVLILENLSQKELIEWELGIQNYSFLKIKKREKRRYEKGEIFSHILGYLGKINKKELSLYEDYSHLDYIGKTGIEKYYERILRGENGLLKIKKDALSRIISEEKIKDPLNGKSLVLTIDSFLQEKIYQVLNNKLKELNLKKGTAIAIDPRNGEVLSLVSLPSFDNNLFSEKTSKEKLKKLIENENHPFFNRAISGLYPVGSTIKPLIASAALQEKIISPNKKILCKGEIEIENPWDPQIVYKFKDWKIHGWTDIKKAIAESCNVFFYTVGGGYGNIEGLGIKRIEKYLKLFWWGKKTGIDLPGEEKGRIPNPLWKREYFKDKEDQIWLPGDTYNLSIGQGFIGVTPLQVATAFQAIANRGVIWKPHLLKEIIDSKGNVIKKVKKERLNENFIEKENLKIVREGMREAVLYGSSVILNDLPIKVASKTGTAQSSKKGYYYNWVTVFAPYDDPEIVLTIVIEDVEGMRLASLPVAKEILRWYFLDKKNESAKIILSERDRSELSHPLRSSF